MLKTIDLTKNIPSTLKVLAGRENGKRMRISLGINEEDLKGDPVQVIVAKDMFSLTSSYFLGLFGNSVRKLGEEGFRKKYVFECADTIRKNIEYGISDALKQSNVLDGE